MTGQQGQAGGKPQEAGFGYGRPCLPSQIPYLAFK